MKLATDAFLDDSIFAILAAPVDIGSEVDETDGGNSLVIKNAHLVADGNPAMFHPLETVLAYTTEAFGAWSQVRRHEQQPTVEQTILTVCDTLSASDFVSASCIVQAIKEAYHGYDLDSDSTQSTTADRKFYSDLAAEFKETPIVAAFNDDGAFGAAHASFTTALKACGAAMEKLMPDKTEVPKKVARAVRQAEANLSVLKDIIHAISMNGEVAAFDFEGFGAEELVQDWAANKSDSWLAKMMRLLDATAKLHGRTFYINFDQWELPGSIRLEMQGSSCNRGNVYDLKDVTALPSMWETSSLCTASRTAIQGATTCLLDAFVASCQLHGIKRLTPLSLATATNITDVCNLFVDPTVMADSAKVSRHYFSTDGAGNLDSIVNFDILLKVLALRSHEAIDLAPGLVKDAAQAMPILEVRAYCTLAAGLHHLASAFLFLQSEAQKGGAIKNNTVRDDIKQVLAVIDTKTTEMLAYMTSEDKVLKSNQAMAVAWFFSTEALCHWFTEAAKSVRLLQEAIVCEMVQGMSEAAAMLDKITPRHEHICNDDTFVRNLVRKNLLNNPEREAIGEQTVGLCFRLTAIGAVSKEFHLQDPANTARHKDAIAYAKCVFAAARKSVTITAAANLVINPGPTAARDAKDLKDKKATLLPKALFAALDEVITGVKKAPKGAKAPKAEA